jgi:queuosine precursor transporter
MASACAIPYCFKLCQANGPATGWVVVQAFQQNVVVGRIAGLRVSSESDRDMYRLRTASDVPLGGASYYGRREGFGRKLGGALSALGRMILPVLTLLAALAGMYLYRDTPVPLSLIGREMPWLTAAHLLVPAGFFCVFLTNRRYGPAYASAQIFLALIAVVALVLFAGERINAFLPLDSVPSLRDAAAFGGAFLAAGLVSSVMFDCARGAKWWSAPLVGFCAAAIVFSFAFFAICYVGTGTAWLKQAIDYMALLAGEGVLLLIPFWLLRRIVPPMSGFGGY